MPAEKLDSTLHNHLVSRGRRSAGDSSPLRPDELGPVQEDALHRVERYLKFLKGLGDPELRQAIDKHQTTILKGVQSGIAESTRSATRGGEPPRKTRGMDLAKAALGERPSFLVINNEICLDSSLADPAGWQILLDRPEVRKALRPRLAGVGLIIDEGTTALGTGFLVAPNLVMTNRHLAERMFDLDSAESPPPLLAGKGRWYVIFSHEFTTAGPGPLVEGKVRGLRFVSPQRIIEPDFTHPETFSDSDVALLEIDPPHAAQLPLIELYQGNPSFSPELVVVVGHPFFDSRYKQQFDSVAKDQRIAFDSVFGKQFEFKHAAPGYASAFSIPQTMRRASIDSHLGLTTNLVHDVSTLGGNSGSPVLALEGQCPAIGIHFWGQAATAPNQYANLAHPFSSLDNVPNHSGLKRWGNIFQEVLGAPGLSSSRRLANTQQDESQVSSPRGGNGSPRLNSAVAARKPRRIRKKTAKRSSKIRL